MSFLNHTHAPFLLQLFIWNPKGRQISYYPVKGKGCRGLFVGSVGAWKVLCPFPPPSEASWAPLTPWERGTDFKVWSAWRLQHLNIWKALRCCCQRVKHREMMMGEWLCVFLTKLCVFYRELLNCIVLWELRYETVTSWEILRVERGWHWEVKTEMMGDTVKYSVLCVLQGLCMGAHAQMYGSLFIQLVWRLGLLLGSRM